MPDLENYDYFLPPDLIAKAPADPRDSSRLFVYDTQTDCVSLDVFKNLAAHLPSSALMVFNDTKVLPARLFLKKETGGKVEVLLAINELRPEDAILKGIADRRILPGAKLYFECGEHLTVVRQQEQYFFFSLSVPHSQLPDLLEREGKTPIPPYIKESPLSEPELRRKYQSLLAKEGVSIAAPTASLHFTPEVLADLEVKGIKRTDVTLHVGAGTFAPLTETNFKTRSLFTEYCAIDDRAAKALAAASREGRPIIPVGSTAVRTIESFAIEGGF